MTTQTPRRCHPRSYFDHAEFLFEPKLDGERDLEGIVAKWAHGTYQRDRRRTSGLKIKNPEYSQIEGRAELFNQRADARRAVKIRTTAPALALF